MLNGDVWHVAFLSKPNPTLFLRVKYVKAFEKECHVCPNCGGVGDWRSVNKFMTMKHIACGKNIKFSEWVKLPTKIVKENPERLFKHIRYLGGTGRGMTTNLINKIWDDCHRKSQS